MLGIGEKITADVLREGLNKIPEDPYEKFANDNGFSFVAGDKLILPIELEGKIDHPGFIFSHYADTGYFIKSRNCGIHFMENEFPGPRPKGTK